MQCNYGSDASMRAAPPLVAAPCHSESPTRSPPRENYPLHLLLQAGEPIKRPAVPLIASFQVLSTISAKFDRRSDPQAQPIHNACPPCPCLHPCRCSQELRRAALSAPHPAGGRPGTRLAMSCIWAHVCMLQLGCLSAPSCTSPIAPAHTGRVAPTKPVPFVLPQRNCARADSVDACLLCLQASTVQYTPEQLDFLKRKLDSNPSIQVGRAT